MPTVVSTAHRSYYLFDSSGELQTAFDAVAEEEQYNRFLCRIWASDEARVPMAAVVPDGSGRVMQWARLVCALSNILAVICVPRTSSDDLALRIERRSIRLARAA